jgi:hypothetical protein
MKRLAAVALLVLAPLVASAQYNSYTAYAPGTAPSYEGLWWNPAESGWGLSIAHQGDVVFAVWYTFDRDGSPTWFAMPEARLAVEDMDNMMSGMGDVEMMMGMSRNPPIYNGVLYRPSRSSGKLVMTEVGMGTVLFKDKDHAVFAYTVGNVAGSKQVSRMVFASGEHACTLGGTKAAGAENYQDLWFNPADTGWGVNVVHQGDTIFGTYYTYDSAGRPEWYAMSDTRRYDAGALATGYAGPFIRATGPSFDSAWDSSRVRIEQLGSATMLFDARGDGSLMVSKGAATEGPLPMKRMTFAAPGSTCR